MSIKERFKRSLKTAGTKLSEAAIGTREQRQERQNFNMQIRAQEHRGYREGRLKGARQRGYQRGIAESRSGKSSGTLGLVKAGVQGLEDGLTVASNIIGVDVGQNQRRSNHKKHRHHNQSRESDSIIF